MYNCVGVTNALVCLNVESFMHALAMLSYVDMTRMYTCVVERDEDLRWCSIGYLFKNVKTPVQFKGLERQGFRTSRPLIPHPNGVRNSKIAMMMQSSQRIPRA